MLQSLKKSLAGILIWPSIMLGHNQAKTAHLAQKGNFGKILVK